MPGKVYLIPSPIAADTAARVIPEGTRQAIAALNYFLAEDIRTARRYIAGLKIFSSVEGLKFETLNKDTTATRLQEFFKPVIEGVSVGIMSESGCPGVADPGSMAVAYAHAKGIEVIPLTGPSSIVLALMGSGLNGQSFCFHGYLPIKESEAIGKIRELERESGKRKCTQIFIETPYRNNRLYNLLLRNLSPSTRLCVAWDITGKDENIRTRSVAEWRKVNVALPRLPAVFLFQS